MPPKPKSLSTMIFGFSQRSRESTTDSASTAARISLTNELSCTGVAPPFLIESHFVLRHVEY